MLRGTVVLAAALSLAACAGGPQTPPSKGYYKVGKPYQIKGVWYYPAEDYSYDEAGIGSWYGPSFHGKVTANGETYDEMEMTAAHRTLPMPSLVRVTNLDNGRSIVVRVNDRGPYANNRIIDMSRRGAQLLGYENTGTAKLRVQILAEESQQIAAAARAGMPAPALAELDGPAPNAAPRSKIEVAGTPVPGPAAPLPGSSRLAAAGGAGVGAVGAAIAAPTSVPGQEVEGRFLPAPVAVNLPVRQNGQIYVQVGAFGSQDNVNRARAKLGAIGQPANVMPTSSGGVRLQRVRIGPLDSVERADIVLAQVLQSGLTDAKIVVE
ncbi:MAG TPA: septal ring lytic transglycosylase RlpA family protein [Azospirillum sp.]|nr:septal ring lytic transglycosylase RlpA family protein [Azospirillum sp.]